MKEIIFVSDIKYCINVLNGLYNLIKCRENTERKLYQFICNLIFPENDKELYWAIPFCSLLSFFDLIKIQLRFFSFNSF